MSGFSVVLTCWEMRSCLHRQENDSYFFEKIEEQQKHNKHCSNNCHERAHENHGWPACHPPSWWHKYLMMGVQTPQLLLIAQPATLFFAASSAFSGISWAAEIDWFGNGMSVSFLLLLFSFLSLLFFFLSFLLAGHNCRHCRYLRAWPCRTRSHIIWPCSWPP